MFWAKFEVNFMDVQAHPNVKHLSSIKFLVVGLSLYCSNKGILVSLYHCDAKVLHVWGLMISMHAHVTTITRSHIFLYS